MASRMFDYLPPLSQMLRRVLVATTLVMSGAAIQSTSYASIVVGDDACDVSSHTVITPPANRTPGTRLARIMVGGFGAHLETDAERADRAARRAERARQRAVRKSAMQVDHDPDQETVD